MFATLFAFWFSPFARRHYHFTVGKCYLLPHCLIINFFGTVGGLNLITVNKFYSRQLIAFILLILRSVYV